MYTKPTWCRQCEDLRQMVDYGMDAALADYRAQVDRDNRESATCVGVPRSRWSSAYECLDLSTKKLTREEQEAWKKKLAAEVKRLGQKYPDADVEIWCD